MRGDDMNFEEGLAVTQDRLVREADSFAELLERLRSLIPPALIGIREWDRLLERARPLPSTMAAFPFGFELPLHEKEPGADLGVSLVGGTMPAAHFETQGRPNGAATSSANIARLLHQTESKESHLRQVIGRKMMLEYDVTSVPLGTRPAPGIFLRPAERPIIGDGHRLHDVRVVLDALVPAAGWNPDAAERHQIERVYLAQEPHTRIDSLGAFPSRERAIRLAITGFRNTRDVSAFLERSRWPGQRATVAAALAGLEALGGYVSLGVHCDVSADGLHPSLGISFLAKQRISKDPRYWLDSPHQWTAFIDSLRAENFAVPAKLTALADWPQGPTTLFAKSGPFVMLRGIHHIKLALRGGRFDLAKGYVFMVLMAAPTY
ncbi:MAG: hypothetical protein OXF40_08945 [Rhodospirillales bacterium]|nr:hypothetical protein [Rhodospirillales bacterium]